MKKILIISYFFPPCNLTAASRAGSWEKYMPEKGFYPIVLTRNWTGKELKESERLTSSGTNVHVVRKENSEIHFLPYFASLRDKFFVLGTTNRFIAQLSKMFTFVQLIIQNVWVRFIPYSNIYEYAREILRKDSSIRFLLISGNPFEQFYFGYLLKKEFPHIHWIADYRDEWTSSEINEFGFLRALVNRWDVFFEKKWISNTSMITANTRYANKKLSNIHESPVKTLINGFHFDALPEVKYSKNTDKLIIVHNGTLYPTQKIGILVNALRKIKQPAGFKIILKFPGILIKRDVAQRLRDEFKDVPIELNLSERISHQEILKMQLEADLLLMVAHENLKGIIGSKLYEYIGLKKPVLLCPTDHDELEATLENTGLGIVVETEEDLISKLEALIFEKQSTGFITRTCNQEVVDSYRRDNQVGTLVKELILLDE